MPAFSISGPSFGASNSSPLFGAAATTPLFGQGTASASGTPAFGLGKGPSSGGAYGTGASAGAPFGTQSSGTLFGANAVSTSALSTAPAGSAAGFNFGSSGPLTFGTQSSAGPGGAGADAPAFGAQPLNTGSRYFVLHAPPDCASSYAVYTDPQVLSNMHAAALRVPISLQWPEPAVSRQANLNDVVSLSLRLSFDFFRLSPSSWRRHCGSRPAAASGAIRIRQRRAQQLAGRGRARLWGQPCTVRGRFCACLRPCSTSSSVRRQCCIGPCLWGRLWSGSRIWGSLGRCPCFRRAASVRGAVKPGLYSSVSPSFWRSLWGLTWHRLCLWRYLSLPPLGALSLLTCSVL